MPPATTDEITLDWKRPLQAGAFVGYIPEVGERDPSGTILRCVTLGPVPCTLDASTQHNIVRSSFGLVKIVKRGWVNAPYKRPKASNSKSAPPKQEKDTNSKPLFEETLFYGREAMRVYNYTKASAPSDKGPRVDDYFSLLIPGQTLTFSMKSEYVYKENTFPKDAENDLIPAYTMVDLYVAPSSVEQARDGDHSGYGIKLSKVRVHSSSVYSYLKDYPAIFTKSPTDAQELVRKLINEPIFVPGFEVSVFSCLFLCCFKQVPETLL